MDKSGASFTRQKINQDFLFHNWIRDIDLHGCGPSLNRELMINTARFDNQIISRWFWTSLAKSERAGRQKGGERVEL
ncbi:hypothetical protein C9994_12135 [Marivirga lumbricoides]|uniref:Uncharacterized protein n=1 Tax=Marivirga lumbricoides TaxID=1046115 RepID=A0A2T4DKS3_9BACT|nr:hypothetical protein C9994_12135 [Marivirga lumbricoides]